jgi:nondiscriminating glutamyl-tRNA synthetase
MRVRFAPSPTGHLHVGNARTALFNWFLARRSGGTLVLRVEDTDTERSSTASEAGILEDLRWMGLSWDEGPIVGGASGPYRQSERLAIYREHAERLLAQGAAYYCFCSAERIERDRRAALIEGRPPRYAGTCRGIDPGQARARVQAGEAAALRFCVPDHGHVGFDDLVRGHVSFDLITIGDPVIVRSDGRPAYNFAVVVDDALMRISHVVRGEDHISNTPRQLLLYQAFGYEPPRFAHLSLVLGPDHSPLSKRHGATSVAEFRARGYLPEALVNYLALIGWSPGGGDEILPLDEMARRFSIEAVGHSAGVFDEEKLAWINRHYLREADPVRLASLSVPFLQQAGLATKPTEEALAFLASAIGIASDAVDRLADVPSRLGVLFTFDADAALRQPDVSAVLAEPGARDVVLAFADEIAQLGRLSKDEFRAAAGRVRARTGQKGKGLFHPIRVALTGAAAGPELDVTVPAIDRGADLPEGNGLSRIPGCRERAAAFAQALARAGG